MKDDILIESCPGSPRKPHGVRLFTLGKYGSLRDAGIYWVMFFRPWLVEHFGFPGRGNTARWNGPVQDLGIITFTFRDKADMAYFILNFQGRNIKEFND